MLLSLPLGSTGWTGTVGLKTGFTGVLQVDYTHIISTVSFECSFELTPLTALTQNMNIMSFSFTADLWLFLVLILKVSLDSVSDQSQAERSNAIAVAGAVMGAVLALFLIAVFIIVILTARKAPSPAFTDKV